MNDQIIADLDATVLNPTLEFVGWTHFTDVHSVTYGTTGYDLCGDRSYILNISPTPPNTIHTLDATTPKVSMASALASDVADYTCTLTVGLVSYPTVPTITTAGFACNMNPCVVDSFTLTTPLTGFTYTIGSGALPITWNTDYVQTPACGYPTVQYDGYIDASGTAVTTESWLTHDQTAFTIDIPSDTTEATIRQLFVKHTITAHTEPDGTTAGVNVHEFQFPLTIFDPCTTSTIVDRTLADMNIQVFTTTDTQDGSF